MSATTPGRSARSSSSRNQRIFASSNDSTMVEFAVEPLVAGIACRVARAIRFAAAAFEGGLGDERRIEPCRQALRGGCGVRSGMVEAQVEPSDQLGKRGCRDFSDSRGAVGGSRARRCRRMRRGCPFASAAAFHSVRVLANRLRDRRVGGRARCGNKVSGCRGSAPQVPAVRVAGSAKRSRKVSVSACRGNVARHRQMRVFLMAGP